MTPPNKSASASVLDGRRMKLVNFAVRRRGKDVQGYGSWSTGSDAVANYQIIKSFPLCQTALTLPDPHSRSPFVFRYWCAATNRQRKARTRSREISAGVMREAGSIGELQVEEEAEESPAIHRSLPLADLLLLQRCPNTRASVRFFLAPTTHFASPGQ